MKKVCVLLLSLTFLLFLTGCERNSPFNSVEEASDSQILMLETVVKVCGISVKSCEKNIVEKPVDRSFTHYILTDKNGERYHMVLKRDKEDLSVAYIVNASGELIYGGPSGLAGEE